MWEDDAQDRAQPPKELGTDLELRRPPIISQPVARPRPEGEWLDGGGARRIR